MEEADNQQSAIPNPQSVDELAILDGGVTITVEKIDGSSEQVKVRQLTIRLAHQWGSLQSEEAELIELLCNKQNRSAAWNIRNEHAIEARLLQILGQAAFEQIDFIEKRLGQTRENITKLEAAEHWSDSLTEESWVKIIELGDRLNRERFARWTERMTKSIGPTTKSIIELLLAKLQPPSPLSSASGTPAT